MKQDKAVETASKPPPADTAGPALSDALTLRPADAPTLPALSAEVRPLTGFLLEELEDAFEALGEKRFHAVQILAWLYRRCVTDFEAMTDLSRELRAKLPEHFRLRSTEVAKEHRSADGTLKLLLRLPDGNRIETVLIPEEDRRTICVSTQVGCPIACIFCASGMDGLVRNLTTPRSSSSSCTSATGCRRGSGSRTSSSWGSASRS